MTASNSHTVKPLTNQRTAIHIADSILVQVNRGERDFPSTLRRFLETVRHFKVKHRSRGSLVTNKLNYSIVYSVCGRILITNYWKTIAFRPFQLFCHTTNPKISVTLV